MAAVSSSGVVRRGRNRRPFSSLSFGLSARTFDAVVSCQS